MRQKIEIAVLVIVLVVVGITPCLVAAQGVSLEDQLKAQYKLVKMGSDTSGYAVVDAGTLLAIQKGGILAVRRLNLDLALFRTDSGTLGCLVDQCTHRGAALSRGHTRKVATPNIFVKVNVFH